MRVLIVVHGFPPAAQGGSEIYADLQARTLRDHYRDDVFVLTREQNPALAEYSVRRERRDGLAIAWVNNTFRTTRSFAETYRNDAIGTIAARLIDDFKPDVAHVHHLTCLSTTIVRALADRHVPCFFTLHDYWLLCHRGQLLDRDYRLCRGPEPAGCHACLDPGVGVAKTGFATAPAIRALERRLPPGPAGQLRTAARRVAALVARPGDTTREAQQRFEHMREVAKDVTRFLAPSQHIRQRFIAFGIPPGRITWAPYGFDRAPFEGIVRTSADRLRLGFLGSLMVSKAPDVLLEAFGQLPRGAASVEIFGAHAAYHGDDRYQTRLAPMLAQEGIHVHGPVPHDQVAAALAAVDVLVVPSIWPENSPLVIQEAFLAGVPVVASRIGGIPEVVHDGVNGLLFRAGDVQDLAGILVRVLREPELLTRLRSGIPSVRTIEEDIALTRGLQVTEVTSRERPPSPSGRSPRTAAVVLNYGTPDETLLAVKALLASDRPFHEVIVVDQGPGDACHQALRDVISDIKYRPTGENLGFAGGMNVGISEALAGGATGVLLVNSDVFVPPDCLGRLLQALEARPGAGIAGPVVLARSEPDRVASLGISYRPLAGRMRHLAYGARRASLDVPAVSVVDAVSGCLMLVSREVFDAVGLLSEEYFFSFEDVDFCLRARRAGFTTVLAGAATAHHEGGRSIGANSPRRLYFATRNHLLMASRAAPSDRGFTRFCRSLSIVALNLAYAARSRGGSLTARLGAVTRGTGDHLAGRYGEGLRR